MSDYPIKTYVFCPKCQDMCTCYEYSGKRFVCQECGAHFSERESVEASKERCKK